MNRRFTKLLILALLFGGLIPAALLRAADDKESLRKRFEERDPALRQLKQQGKIGETYLGYIEAVKPEHAQDAKVRELTTAENNDRKLLYPIIAKEQNTTPEKVAERNAQRNFSLAGVGEWLKGPNGWYQKK